MKYILGLDPGVASIGWGIIEYDENDNPIRIVDHGSVIFKPLDNDKGKLYNQVRRDARGTRRVVRRRKERLRRIRNLILNTFDMKEAEYNDLFFKKGVVQDNDILELKVKGLSDELTKEQLIRVLIHYAKNRGFKSNRKIDADEEKGKMKSAIANVKKIMADNNYTVSKAILLYQKENDLAIRHNTNDNYNYGYERSDVKEEIDILLDKQIELGVIDEKFKKKYVEIWSSQRDYSEGPASGPYKVDWYKTFGRCRFDGNPRISRACPSFEFFTLIQKLQNLRYYLLDDNKERLKEDGKIKKYQLSSDDINELFKTAKTKELKYSAIKKHLENKNSGYEVEIVDLPSISKSDFNKLVTKFKKDNDIDSKQKLNEFQYSKIKELAKEESLNKVLYSLNSFKDLKKQLKKLDDVKINDVEFMDDAATILSYAKTDKAIDKVIKEHYENDDFSKEEIELIKKLKTKISGTGSLSLDLTRQLITLMLDGKTYDEAMKELNHDHSKPLENVSFTNGFPTIKEIEQKYDTIITQPNVKHTLVYLRKLYNRIVETYGEPWKLHLELARDIRKPFLERLAIKHEQQSNYAANLDAKEEIWNTLGKADIENRNFKSFTAEDTLRFRLWKEQGGVCAYSQEIIEPNDVLKGRDLEVDHILPFSRSFDDSYNNKVLVYKKANQEKKNRTPYEWLGKHADKTRWFKFKRWVENNKLLSDQKKNNLLYEEDVTFDEFSDRSLNSTGYISRLALQIFKDLLNCEDDQDRVRSFKGTATSYLRKYYRLNGYTHSYESARYLLKDTVYIIKDDGIKVETGKDSASLKIVATDKFGREIDTIEKYEKKNASFQNLKIEKSFDLLQTDTEFFINYAKDILVNKDLNSIDDYSILNTDDEKEKTASEILFEAINDLKSQINGKNRDNHLHHEVDAILIASMTRSMQLKITKFSKLLRQSQYTNKPEIIDEDTGQTFSNLKELAEAYNVDTVNKDSRFYIPQPYSGFVDELVIKVFERNEEVLNRKLEELLGYDPHAKVKYPSFQANKKVSGALHAETIYGKAIENNSTVATIRKDVTSLTKKDLDKIYDKDGGQKAVKEAVEKWLELSSEERKLQKYPVISGTNIQVKKVKMKDDNFDKMIKISPNSEQKGYAQIAEVVRIQVYKKENDDKLYFVQLSIDKYIKRKNGELDFPVLVWWGRDKNKKEYKYNELTENGFELLLEMYPGQHIYLKKKDGSDTFCLVVGFSSGMFEIGSILGDKIDLIKNNISNKVKNQMQITISTIESIRPIHIDILGNLCPIDN